MMPLQDAGWESLVQRAEQIEQRARRRAIVFSVIPAVLAGLLLWFTGYQIQQANRQLVKVQGATQAALAQRDDAQAQLAQTQDQFSRVQSDLVATQKKLEDTQRAFVTTQRALSDTQRAFVTTQQALSDTQQTLSAMQSQLKQTEQDKESLQKQLDGLKKSLDDASKQLKLATTLSKSEMTGSWYLGIKGARSIPLQDLMMQLMRLQGVGWKLGGFSPQEGFDSPSFAAYALGQSGLIKNAEAVRYQLPSVLPPRTRPQVGDVVFYQMGYTMFYFMNDAGEPFVIGMTPLGVLALKPDFAPVLGYGAVFP